MLELCNELLCQFREVSCHSGSRTRQHLIAVFGQPDNPSVWMHFTKRVREKYRWKKGRKERGIIRYLSSHTSLLSLPHHYPPEGRGASSKPCHEFLTTLSVCTLRRCMCVSSCVCTWICMCVDVHRKHVGEGEYIDTEWCSPTFSINVTEITRAQCMTYQVLNSRYTQVSYHRRAAAGEPVDQRRDL